jgi:hypothetical protein
VNPPKAKKEKIFVEPGHHSLWYSFYYFCHNVKSEIGKRIEIGIGINPRLSISPAVDWKCFAGYDRSFAKCLAPEPMFLSLKLKT